MGGIANLTPMVKGMTINPNGRPKGSKDGLLACIRRTLRNNPNADILSILKAKGVDPERIERLKDVTVRDGVAAALAAEMLAGNYKAVLGWLRLTEDPNPMLAGGLILGMTEQQALELLQRRGNVLLPDARAALVDMRPGDEVIDAEAVQVPVRPVVEPGDGQADKIQERQADPDYCI